MSQDPAVHWDERLGAMESFVAGLLDKGKTVYLVSSARDMWSNPLGAWASFRAAPLLATSSDAAERLRLKTLPDSNHCGFPTAFDLNAEFSSDAKCHLRSSQCKMVDDWLENATLPSI